MIFKGPLKASNLIFLKLVLASLVAFCTAQSCHNNWKHKNCHRRPYVEQPYKVDDGNYDGFNITDGSLCTRKCVPGDNRICYYKFIVESYTTMGAACKTCPNVTSDCFGPQCIPANGYERSVVVVNRMMPGPSIQVCQNDIVVVGIYNDFPGSGITIHWHGIRQIKTPWYDGVPSVTQCPIPEKGLFQVAFICDDYGTFFWHSHDALQKLDGFLGSIAIRQPDEENKLKKYYDFDLPSHVILFQDWFHELAEDRSPGRQTRPPFGQIPDALLVQGLGRNTSLLDTSTQPVAIFNVTKDFKYRFRLIAGTCLACSYRFRIENHNMTILTTDDSNIQPVENVDALDLAAAERIDVVIYCNQPARRYWMTITGLGPCTGVNQVAILNYQGSTNSAPTQATFNTLINSNPLFIYNQLGSGCNDTTLSTGICVSQVRNLEKNPPQISRKPDYIFIMNFGFFSYNTTYLFGGNKYHHYFSPAPGVLVTSYINNITHVPNSSPPLTQFADIPSSEFCTRKLCSNRSEPCECSHLIKVRHNSVAWIVIVDENGAGLSHPFHLHGHDFYIWREGLLSETNITELRTILKDPNLYKQVGKYLPSKDTIRVPPSGWIIASVYFDNRGIWLFHCHFLYHQKNGMEALFQVGEANRFLPPPRGFPRCNNFEPTVPPYGYWDNDK